MALSKRTRAVHSGIKRSQFNELSEALYLTQSFAYDSAEIAEKRFEKADEDEFIYARYGSPTVRMFEERIATFEGAEDAFATASGMAAVNGALMSMLSAGDRVVAARALFGSCIYILEDILPRFGVQVEFVDGTDARAWETAITANTKLIFLESISNPALELVDIAHVSALAHRHGARVIVDNVFTTPVFSNVFEQGADVVIYSATKHIDGQGRALGGVILGSRDYIRSTVEPFLKHTGASISPFNAWILLKGMETLDLRVRAQSETALALAQAFEQHPKVTRALYPGLSAHPQHALAMKQIGSGGTVLSLDFGTKEAAFKALNAFKIFTISNNLGDAKSLATHPATTTHQRLSDEQKKTLGISAGLVRFSIGLESAEDLIADVMQALDKL